MTTVKTKPPKGKKLLLFKVIAVLFPFVLLFVLEILLRLFHYGHNTDLFIQDPNDSRFMVMNNYASDKYFSDTLNATKGNHELFAIDKSPNTVRIFVLGESTTIGYPYFHNGAFHRWLQFRLMQMYPDKNFEIVNLSLTAVNSYTVLDFGRQLPQYKPDAVLIYTGHNEYYGALGVGSTSYVGSNRFLVQTLLKLRDLKLVQLLNNFMKKVAGVFSPGKIDDRETLMKRMAARQHIDYNSADFKAGIKQYEQNMGELCRILNDNHIPTFLSTVVSNEKDLKPFVSTGSGLNSADYNYTAGQQALKQGNAAAAKQYFDKARELDGLRFRAPDEINIVIQKLATEYPSVHLVDTKKIFEQHSPNGIIGHETILEHVHPNLFGYALMSEAFFQAMSAQNLIGGAPVKQFTFEELQKEMPITGLDTLNGQDQINALKTAWPFNEPATVLPADTGFVSQLAAQVAGSQLHWDEAMQQLFEYDKRTDNKLGALKVMEGMVLEQPQNSQFYGYAGNLNAILGDFDDAAFYYKKMYDLSPSDQVSQTLFQLYLRADEPNKALDYIKTMPQAQQDAVQGLILQILTNEATLKKDPSNKQVSAQIAAYYRQLGVPETALKYSK